MSGFDDNPFGEPTVSSPFDSGNATRNSNNLQGVLEDYNPFEDEANDNQPATLNPVPVYTQSGQQYQVNNNAAPAGPNSATQISTAELQKRQEELEKKAAELERREAELNSGGAARPNNWPPVPAICPFQPCFYHDINVDIPIEFQKIVQNLYYLWMLYTLVMCVNIIGGLVILFHSSEFSTFGLAIFYCVLFTPASFLCWYRPAYKAFKTDSSFNFMMFFFIFFFQTLVTIIQTIGIPGSGTCGLIMAIKQFDNSAGGIMVGLFLILIAIGYGACAGGNIVMLSKIHAIYRSGTDENRMSMTKAREEFQTGFFGNQHVRDAAAGATRATINSQFGNGNRY